MFFVNFFVVNVVLLVTSIQVFRAREVGLVLVVGVVRVVRLIFLEKHVLVPTTTIPIV